MVRYVEVVLRDLAVVKAILLETPIARIVYGWMMFALFAVTINMTVVHAAEMEAIATAPSSLTGKHFYFLPLRRECIWLRKQKKAERNLCFFCCQFIYYLSSIIYYLSSIIYAAGTIFYQICGPIESTQCLNSGIYLAGTGSAGGLSIFNGSTGVPFFHTRKSR